MTEAQIAKRKICYIMGSIKLEYDLPDSFEGIEPTVTIDDQPSFLKEDKESDVKSWTYLAIVESGMRRVTVRLGNVETVRQFYAREAEINHLDFAFIQKE